MECSEPRPRFLILGFGVSPCRSSPKKIRHQSPRNLPQSPRNLPSLSLPTISPQSPATSPLSPPLSPDNLPIICPQSPHNLLRARDFGFSEGPTPVTNPKTGNRVEIASASDGKPNQKIEALVFRFLPRRPLSQNGKQKTGRRFSVLCRPAAQPEN